MSEGGGSPWDRQKRELESYNTFYSAYTGRADSNSLSDNGYVVVSRFPEINYRHIDARPDFFLYNDETVLLVEVKTGNNIDSRDIEQMERCDEVTIEAAEEFLKDAKVEERFGYDSDVGGIETCIIYQGMDEEFVSECKDSKNCRESLSELVEFAPVLTQNPDSSLRILEGEFSTEPLDSLLREGIEIAENPKKEVFLTDGAEVESIAVAACLIWGKQATSDEVTVSPGEVASYFAPGRAVNIRTASRAFEFLENKGICRSEEKENESDEYATKKFIFSPEDMKSILNIERIMEKEGSIRDEDQSDFSDFS